MQAGAKSEGIPILRAVFDFSEEEANQAESASLGWRSWFKTQPQTQPTLDPTKSFSELFVDFLETESDQSTGNQAPHFPAFPANKMVAEVGRRGSLGQSDKNKGIEGRNLLNGPVIPSRNGLKIPLLRNSYVIETALRHNNLIILMTLYVGQNVVWIIMSHFPITLSLRNNQSSII